LLSLIGTQPFIDLGEGLRSMGFYNFNPNAMRSLQMPLPGALLERDGRNLASVIEGLKEIDPDAVQRMREYLSLIAEGVESFDPVRHGEYETVQFRVNSPGKSVEFDAANMSDGTLRALGALVAGFQIQLPAGPTVVGIEEAETSLHPAAMRALLGALEDATGRTQILLTTHSSDLLSERRLDTSQILVVRNRNGQTQIGPVDPASQEIIRKELYTLADLQRMDHLAPDEADLERQARANARDGDA
jgi:predicted ATPase